jgi:hypothetical protein
MPGFKLTKRVLYCLSHTSSLFSINKFISSVNRDSFTFSFPLDAFFFFFLVGLGFEVKASSLQKQVLYHLSHTSSPFCCGYLRDGVLGTIVQSGSNHNPPDLSLPSS